jgi:hypothetical protein
MNCKKRKSSEYKHFELGTACWRDLKITGTVVKGFQADSDGTWLCKRRNYWEVCIDASSSVSEFSPNRIVPCTGHVYRQSSFTTGGGKRSMKLWKVAPTSCAANCPGHSIVNLCAHLDMSSEDSTPTIYFIQQDSARKESWGLPLFEIKVNHDLRLQRIHPQRTTKPGEQVAVNLTLYGETANGDLVKLANTRSDSFSILQDGGSEGGFEKKLRKPRVIKEVSTVRKGLDLSDPFGLAESSVKTDLELVDPFGLAEKTPINFVSPPYSVTEEPSSPLLKSSRFFQPGPALYLNNNHEFYSAPSHDYRFVQPQLKMNTLPVYNPIDSGLGTPYSTRSPYCMGTPYTCTPDTRYAPTPNSYSQPWVVPESDLYRGSITFTEDELTIFDTFSL